MRFILSALLALALLAIAPGRASAQWIPDVSPGGAAIGPNPVFPGLSTSATPPAVTPPVAAESPRAAMPSVQPLSRTTAPAQFPDTTWMWLTYYGSPSSPTFVPADRVRAWRPVTSR